MKSLSSCREAPASSSSSRSATATALPQHPDILELPGIGFVEILRKQTLPLVQRCPVGVLAHERPEVGSADLQVAPKVHLIRLDQATIRVLHRPDDTRQHGGSHLQ